MGWKFKATIIIITYYHTVAKSLCSLTFPSARLISASKNLFSSLHFMLIAWAVMSFFYSSSNGFFDISWLFFGVEVATGSFEVSTRSSSSTGTCTFDFFLPVWMGVDFSSPTPLSVRKKKLGKNPRNFKLGGNYLYCWLRYYIFLIFSPNFSNTAAYCKTLTRPCFHKSHYIEWNWSVTLILCCLAITLIIHQQTHFCMGMSKKAKWYM